MGFGVQYRGFGAKLRTGSLVIGYVSLVVNITLIMLLIGAFVTLQDAGDFVNSQDSNMNDSEHETFAIVMFSVILTLVFFNLMTGIVLLIGLHKYKLGFGAGIRNENTTNLVPVPVSLAKTRTYVNGVPQTLNIITINSSNKNIHVCV